MRKFFVIAVMASVSFMTLGHESVFAQSKMQAGTFMERANILAKKGSVSSAELANARKQGSSLKIVKNQKAGKDFAKACQKLYSATNNPAGLAALASSDAKTMAMCAGFIE